MSLDGEVVLRRGDRVQRAAEEAVAAHVVDVAVGGIEEGVEFASKGEV